MATKKFSEFTPLRTLNSLDSLRLYKENPCQFMEEQIVINNDNIPEEKIDFYYKVRNNRILIKLEPFQKEFINAILLTKNKNGYRYYDEAVLAIGKKNGKSSLASYIALYLFFMDKEDSQYVFTANSEDQAGILSYGNFITVCGDSPNLAERAIIKKSYVQRKNSNVKAFAVPYANARNHGLINLVFVAHDEPHGYVDNSLYTAFTRIPNKKEFLALSTSYAGFDKRSAYRQLCERGRKGLSPTLYYKSYECAEDILELWKNANPASWVTMDYLNRQKLALPDVEFKRMHLNMWVSFDNSTKLQQFVTEEQVIAITNPNLAPTELAYPTKTYVCGVDLGVIHDNTAIAVMHLEGNKIILDRLDVWQPTKEKPIDIDEIEKRMMEIRARYKCLFIIDPSQMENTIQKFIKLYGSHTVKRFNFRGIYNELTELMCKVIKARELEIYPDAGLHYDSKGNRNTLQTEMTALYIKHLGDSIRFDHESKGKSDMTIAVAMCVYELVMRPVQYEVRLRDPLGDLMREKAKAGLGNFSN